MSQTLIDYIQDEFELGMIKWVKETICYEY